MSNKSSNNREDVLTRLSKKNFSSDIINNEEESINNEGKRIGRNIINRPIEVKILDTDPSALAVLKQCILDAELTTQDVYDRIGRQKGYGMIYDLENKNRCTMNVFDIWMSKVLYLDVIYSIKELSEKEIENNKNTSVKTSNRKKKGSKK